MTDPGAQVRAAILVGAMTFEPAPLDLFEIRVPAIRRVVDRIEPPLNLNVIPFRYRVTVPGMTFRRSMRQEPRERGPRRAPAARARLRTNSEAFVANRDTRPAAAEGDVYVAQAVASG